MSGSQTPCPSRDELEALLDDRLPEPQRAKSLAHLHDCQPCSDTYSTLANTWSFGDAAREEAPAGTNTIAFEARLRAQRPEPAAAPAEIPPQPPEIAGYDSLEVVTAGGMGIVYRARDTTLGRPVAIKLISAHAIHTAPGRQRALREAELLARLSHPSICTIHAAGTWRDQPYLVMEWIAGPTLQERIDEAPLPPAEAACIARDLAEALSSVHAAGIVHRDLKPDNVLLADVCERRGAAIPKLIDFGLAHPDNASQELTIGDTVLGTPSFMAAEQTGLDESLGPVTPATDIHGLGGLLFAMLTGHAPYQASTLMASLQRALRGDLAGRARLAEVPDELRRIVLRCLQPQPAKRYASAASVAEALRQGPTRGRAGCRSRPPPCCWPRRLRQRTLASSGPESLRSQPKIAPRHQPNRCRRSGNSSPRSTPLDNRLGWPRLPAVNSSPGAQRPTPTPWHGPGCWPTCSRAKTS
jgi:serine/threonine protein kinase